jgi:hypothetical protein
MSATQATQFVETLVQDIQSLFSQIAQPEKLTKFMSNFSQQFEMTTLTGAQINYEQLTNMFTQNMGAFPDLTIEVDEISIIMETKDFVLLSYRETQYKSGICHKRRATAMIEFHVEQCLWRYLHETTITP